MARNEVLGTLANQESTKLDAKDALSKLETQENRTKLVSKIDEGFSSLNPNQQEQFKGWLGDTVKDTLAKVDDVTALADKVLALQYTRENKDGTGLRSLTPESIEDAGIKDEELAIVYAISAYCELEGSGAPAEIHMFLMNNKVDSIAEYNEEVLLKTEEDGLNIVDTSEEVIEEESEDVVIEDEEEADFKDEEYIDENIPIETGENLDEDIEITTIEQGQEELNKAKIEAGEIPSEEQEEMEQQLEEAQETLEKEKNTLSSLEESFNAKRSTALEKEDSAQEIIEESEVAQTKIELINAKEEAREEISDEEKTEKVVLQETIENNEQKTIDAYKEAITSWKEVTSVKKSIDDQKVVVAEAQQVVTNLQGSIDQSTKTEETNDITETEETNDETKTEETNDETKTEETNEIAKGSETADIAAKEINKAPTGKSKLGTKLNSKPAFDEIDFKNEMRNETFREEMGDLSFTIADGFDDLINTHQEGLKDALSSTSFMTIDWNKLYVENADGNFDLTKTGETMRTFMESGVGIISDATGKMVSDLRKKGYDNEKVLNSFTGVSKEMNEVQKALTNKADVALFFAESSGKEIDKEAYSNTEAQGNMKKSSETTTFYAGEAQETFKNEESMISSLTSSIQGVDDMSGLYDKVSNGFSKYFLDGEVIYTKNPIADEYLNGDQVAENKTEIVKEELKNGEIKGFSLSKLMKKIMNNNEDKMHTIYPNILKYGDEDQHQKLFAHMAGHGDGTFDDDIIWNDMKNQKKLAISKDEIEEKMKKSVQKSSKKKELTTDQIMIISEEAKKIQDTDQVVRVKNGVYDISKIQDNYSLSYYKIVKEDGSNQSEPIFVHKNDSQKFLGKSISNAIDASPVTSEMKEKNAMAIDQKKLMFQKLSISEKDLTEKNISYSFSNNGEHTFSLESGHKVSLSIDGDKVAYNYAFGGTKLSGSFEENLSTEGVDTLHSDILINIGHMDGIMKGLQDGYNDKKSENKDLISDQITLLAQNAPQILRGSGYTGSVDILLSDGSTTSLDNGKDIQSLDIEDGMLAKKAVDSKHTANLQKKSGTNLTSTIGESPKKVIKDDNSLPKINQKIESTETFKPYTVLLPNNTNVHDIFPKQYTQFGDIYDSSEKPKDMSKVVKEAFTVEGNKVTINEDIKKSFRTEKPYELVDKETGEKRYFSDEKASSIKKKLDKYASYV